VFWAGKHKERKREHEDTERGRIASAQGHNNYNHKGGEKKLNFENGRFEMKKKNAEVRGGKKKREASDLKRLIMQTKNGGRQGDERAHKREKKCQQRGGKKSVEYRGKNGQNYLGKKRRGSIRWSSKERTLGGEIAESPSVNNTSINRLKRKEAQQGGKNDRQ